MTVYCLGTSHTYGEYEDYPTKMVEKTYCDFLSEKINYPVVNYGARGSHNLEILEVLMEIIDKKDHYNPTAFIVELRESASPALVEKHASIEILDKLKIISRTREDPSQNIFSAKYEKYWRNENSWKTRSTYNKDVRGYCKVHYDHNIMFNLTDIQILTTWHTIQNLCNYHNIPVKLFAFSPVNKIEDNKENFKYLNGLNTFKWLNLDRNIFTFMTYVVNDKGLDWAESHVGSCGHYTEVVHEYLADLIRDEVKEMIGK